MTTSKDYLIAKELILNGKLKSITALIPILQNTNLAEDMGITPKQLNKKLEDLGEFTLGDAWKIAELIGVSEQTMTLILLEEYSGKMKKRK